MKRKLFAVMICAFLVAFTDRGHAETPVVVELYTSQGCSSCPPADEMLGELSGRDDVIALALHVDYWDYLGWKDAFADPAHTKRQRAYARAAGARTIYTPQMIVGGVDHIIGAKAMKLAETIMHHQNQRNVVSVQLSRQGGKLRIDAVAGAALPDGSVVQLVRFAPQETVEVRRGENAGKTLTYHNIVEDWQVLSEWNGTKPLSLTANIDGPAAVIVQEPGNGRIVGAAQLR